MATGARRNVSRVAPVVFGMLILLATWATSADAQSDAAPAAAVADESPRYLGEMTAFWRNRPVLGRWLKGRLGLSKIPDYVCDPALSFPYEKRPYSEEVMFADHLSVVRLLGGWKYAKGKGELGGGPKADLAYRDENGRIRYRWELLAPRLDHYVKNGYDLTIVLDNTPYCFPDKPHEGAAYGNSAPPADFQEWGDFIAELCRRLVKLYGRDTVGRWRFRMGTECQGTERFTGPQEEYFKLYDYAAAGVRSVLPDADFGPFNLAGAPDTGNVRYYALADHCTKGTNYATGEIGAPLDFASVSIYMAPSVLRKILRTTDPDHKAHLKVDFWNGLAARDARFKDISREVHEFGILGNEFRVGGGEPGARGAAWTFHIMFNLFEGGMDRMWHWGSMEGIPTGKRRQILQGTGWLFCILQHAVGGRVYALEPSVKPREAGATASADRGLRAIAAYKRPEKLARPCKTFHKSIAVVKENRTFIITSAYNEDRFVTAKDRVTVAVPRDLVKMTEGADISCVELTRTNAVYFRLREDLKAAGLLKDEYKKIPGLLSSARGMGGREAWTYVDKNWSRYERIIRDSLTLKPFAGAVRPGQTQHYFTFDMAPPAVMVIVIDHREVESAGN